MEVTNLDEWVRPRKMGTGVRCSNDVVPVLLRTKILGGEGKRSTEKQASKQEKRREDGRGEEGRNEGREEGRTVGRKEAKEQADKDNSTKNPAKGTDARCLGPPCSGHSRLRNKLDSTTRRQFTKSRWQETPGRTAPVLSR